MRTFRVTVELIPEDEGGYTVYCPELDIYTQGETEEECIENAKEAIRLHLEELGEDPPIRRIIRREIEVTAGA